MWHEKPFSRITLKLWKNYGWVYLIINICIIFIFIYEAILLPSFTFERVSNHLLDWDLLCCRLMIHYFSYWSRMPSVFLKQTFTSPPSFLFMWSLVTSSHSLYLLMIWWRFWWLPHLFWSIDLMRILFPSKQWGCWHFFSSLHDVQCLSRAVIFRCDSFCKFWIANLSQRFASCSSESRDVCSYLVFIVKRLEFLVGRKNGKKVN